MMSEEMCWTGKLWSLPSSNQLTVTSPEIGNHKEEDRWYRGPSWAGCPRRYIVRLIIKEWLKMEEGWGCVGEMAQK